MYRLNNGNGKISWLIPSLAGAQRLAKQITDPPRGMFIERWTGSEWRRMYWATGPSEKP